MPKKYFPPQFTKRPATISEIPKIIISLSLRSTGLPTITMIDHSIGRSQTGKSETNDSSTSRDAAVQSTMHHDVYQCSSDSSEELKSYDLDAAINAWDEIGELSHEITSSIMAKQAAILCERFRNESDVPSQSPNKKRRLASTENRSEDLLSLPNHDISVVTSDEESSNSTGNDSLPLDMSSQIERIGRMSRLVLEIEFCHQKLRREMMSMNDELM